MSLVFVYKRREKQGIPRKVQISLILDAFMRNPGVAKKSPWLLDMHGESQVPRPAGCGVLLKP